MVNFGPAAAVVSTRLALRPIPHIPTHWTLSTSLCSGPLTDTCDSFRLSHSETRGVNLCGTTEGVRMGLGGWNFSYVPPCLAPLLYPTVYLSSDMVYFPVVHHSALIMCYGIVLFAESEKGTPARFFLQYTLYWHLIWNGSAIAALSIYYCN